jgi:O-antigen/teichoic acid export membrane protein
VSAVESTDAGDRIIRGGALRSGGYLVSTGSTAIVFAFLLRHLGVDDFGRFATVIALVAVAVGLTEAGLTVIGQRRYAAGATLEDQRAVLADLVGIRLGLTPMGVALAVAFSLIAGYSSTMVVGVVVAGVGGILTTTAQTLALPLTVELKLGRVTIIEVVRQLTVVAVIVVLVALDAGLGAFFWAYLVSGVVMMLVAVLLVPRAHVAGPSVALRRWTSIVREAGPLALSIAINTFYVRMLIVLASLLVAQHEVGLFATASRVTEVLLGLPVFMFGTAFPLLAHAGTRDEARLAYAMQRIAEVALLVAGLFIVVLEIGAEPIVRIFGGEAFLGAVPVLRWQALALLGATLTQAWMLGLVAVQAQRALVWVNVVALATVAVLGLSLIPPFEAQGASVAAALGEATLAAATLMALVRARPALRPAVRNLPRVVLAAGLAALLVLSPLPDAVDAALGAGVFLGAAYLLGVVPVELATALLRRGEPAVTV